MQTYAGTLGADIACDERVHKAAKHVERMDPAVLDTAGAVTYTAAEVLGGLIVRDCNGGARSDVLPTAALLLAAMRSEQVGDIVKCLVVNNSDAAETITITAGSGGDFTQIADTRVVPQNTSRMLYIRVTDVTTPAYLVYM